MADLVTHLAVVLLPAAAVRSRWIGCAVLGAALPDLSGRIPGLALQLVHGQLFRVPEWLFWPLGVLHTPLAQLLLCGLVGSLFVPEERNRARLALALGAGTHFLLDVLQDHHGAGYYLLYPLSSARWELEWIGSEATVDLALPLLGITAAAWAVRIIASRRAPATPSRR